MSKIIFPQYRRYKNHKNFFKIESQDSFEEIRALGKKWMIEKHVVKILPDRNLVHDLLYNFEEFAEKISSVDYEAARQVAKDNLR